MLTTILTEGITKWFNNKILQPADYPAPFHQLIHQQNNIGWHQLFHSRFVSKWQQLQNHHLRTKGIKEITLTGQSWTTFIILHLWKAFFEVWEQQNKVVHGKDKIIKASSKHVKGVSQTKHLRSKKTDVLAAHRSIMFMTIQYGAPTCE